MSDEAAIRKILETYHQGIVDQDVPTLQSLFHANAVLSGWLGPELLVGSLEPFFDYVRNSAAGDNYKSEITDVWVDDNMATVSVSERELFGMSFTDRLHFVKQGDGSWIIVSKLFRHH